MRALATGGGIGYAPFAPGTFGTLLGIPVYLALIRLPSPLHLAAAIAIALSAVHVAGRAEHLFGAKDPGAIVIDEIAGFQFALLWVEPSLPIVAAGFLFFRFFDILKPFPARNAEALPAGWGVVGDDVVAGIYANAVLLILLKIVL
ncbi:MAG TPA: phosphatidylglycerophosphatase A [Syntrophales bacterium]|nr:phosphatidylglycerophosphatase A [Syntrophales bacterium]HPL62681.1 phosphatidylglycerophosphatase A [Syntrophales bacterium]